MNKDILIVEDDALSQFVIVEMCKELGFGCKTADDGAQAVDILGANSDAFSVVLMDIHMPRVSGVDAIKIIRQSPDNPPRDIPIVATTADERWYNPEQYLAHGFNSALPKPLTFSRLSQVLKEFAA